MGDLLKFKSKIDRHVEQQLGLLRMIIEEKKADNARHPVKVVFMTKEGFIKSIDVDRNFPPMWRIPIYGRDIPIAFDSSHGIPPPTDRRDQMTFHRERDLDDDVWLYVEL